MTDKGQQIKRAEHWETQILKMLDSGNYDWADKYLYSVLQSIEDYENITDDQIQAVQNIKYGRKE